MLLPKNINLSSLFFSLSFIGYVAFGLAFFGFKGYTWIPQVIGGLMALGFITYVAYFKESFVFETTCNLFLIFLVYISISIVVFFPSNLNYTLSIFQMLILYVIVLNLVGKYGMFWEFMIGIILSCIILIGNRISEFSPDEIGRHMIRVGSTAGNQNDYGFILASSVNLLLIAKLYIKENLKLGWLLHLFLSGIIAVVSLECIIFSGSRTGTVIIFFSVFLYSMYQLYISNFFFKLVYVGLGTVFISIAAAFAKNLPIYYRFLGFINILTGSGKKDFSAGRRLELIEIGIYRWLQKPIFGHGTGRLRYINLDGTYTHNNFAELLANNGIVGLLLFYSIHIFISIFAIKLWMKTRSSYLWFFLIVIISLLLADMGMVNYYNKVYYLVLAFISGMLYRETLKIREQICVEY